MWQSVCERFLLERLGRGELRPRISWHLAIPEAEHLPFETGIDTIDYAVAVQVAIGTAIEDLEVRGCPKQQARGLKPHTDLRCIDADRDEDRVTHRERTDTRNEL